MAIPLSIIAVGHVHFEAVEALTKHFAPVEELVLDVHPRSDLEQHRAELNRAADAASNDWILIVREPERVDDTLAAEIAGSAGEAPRAWGYRIPTIPIYAGQPLRLGDKAGELRLFHRRHFLRRGGLTVQGTVIRLNGAFRAATFASVNEHRDYLARSGVPHSSLRRLLLFLRNAAGSRTLDANTLRYLWIEAGYDHGWRQS
jgi:hypothetical protein